MYFTTILFLLLTAQVGAQTNDNLLFNQVIKNNLAVQSQGKTIESEKVNKGYLGRSFYPTLSLELGQENFQTGSYKTRSQPHGMLEARFNLFRGGRDKIESRIKNIYTQISEYKRDLSIREEINKIRKLQYQIMFNMELVSILKKELAVNKRINAQALQRAKSGVTTRTDTLEFTINESELIESIESLEHENKILKIGIKPLLGISQDEEINFSMILEHQHDDELISRGYSFNKHPEVATLHAEFASLSNQQEMKQRWWTPSLDLYGGYYLYTLRDRDYLAMRERDDRVVGLRLTMELFDGRKGSTESSAAHYQAESKRMMARHTEKQTEARFLMLKEDLKHTHEVMHYVLDRIKKSKDYLDLTLKEYDRGIKNSLDALTAMQRYYRYEKQYLEKKKEYQVIKADLLSIIGE